MATRIREKANKRKENKDLRPKAFAKHIRLSSDKVEIVLNLVRGKSYNDAAAILSNSDNKASKPILKVLNSAAANAENNQNLNKDDLFVAETYATQGPSVKKLRKAGKNPKKQPRDIVKRRSAHITVILDTVEDKK